MSDEPRSCEVEYCRNPDAIIFHHPIRMPRIFDVKHPPRFPEDDDDTSRDDRGEVAADPIDESGMEFLGRLASIPGVARVNSWGYEIVVWKGRVFPWRPIVDAVAREFRDRYGVGLRKRAEIRPDHASDVEVR